MNWIEDPSDDEEDDAMRSPLNDGPGPVVSGCAIVSALILITGIIFIIYRLLAL
jgi:outer membrane usher protein FimD/PapC